MQNRSERFRAYFSGLQQSLLRTTLGGNWIASESLVVQRNLGNFWLDGLFANASDAILLTYLTLYILALGATEQQIGLLSALGSLSATLLLLPGAILVERIGFRKRITVASGGITARLMILSVVVAPFVFQGQSLVYVVIALEVLRQAFGNLALPAWISLTGDIVPLSWRGTYFASRNIAMSISSIVVTIFTGQLITRMDAPAGYQAALGMAFVFGVISTFFFSRLHEKPLAIAAPSAGSVFSFEFFRPLIQNKQFLIFCLTAALWNFALNITGPFFGVYQAKYLMLSPAIIGILSTVSSFASLPAQKIMGPLSDHLGPYRVQMLMGLLIPLLPIGWFFVTKSAWAPWQITVINIVGGFFWAGYSLASFNLLLLLAPTEQRARISAVYQVIVSISLALGAAVGGYVVGHWGFHTIFLLSAFGRWIAAILFARFVKPPSISQ